MLWGIETLAGCMEECELEAVLLEDWKIGRRVVLELRKGVLVIFNGITAVFKVVAAHWKVKKHCSSTW